jgi:hypothetical protein
MDGGLPGRPGGIGGVAGGEAGGVCARRQAKGVKNNKSCRDFIYSIIPRARSVAQGGVLLNRTGEPFVSLA